MTPFLILLIVATFLVALVAGFLVAFALVVMPGLARLPDADYLRAFQAIDGVIQNRPDDPGDPRFLLLWLGSAAALLAAAVAGFFVPLPPLDRALLLTATALYLLGVQLPTIVKNIPLNNALQKLDPQTLNEADLTAARHAFESPWNRWNLVRTALAGFTTALLLTWLARL